MTTLRWILGLGSAVMAVGWVLLVIVAAGFRGSFGASSRGTLSAALVTFVLLLVLACTLAPHERWLLHFGAAVALLAAAGAVHVLRASLATAFFALAYLALFFIYYWQVAWRGRS